MINLTGGRLMQRAMVLAISFALAACSSNQGGVEAAQTASRPNTRRAENVITESEIAASTARDGLEIVQLLRPGWLRGRGSATVSEVTPLGVTVYVDNQHIGGTDVLRQFTAGSIKTMRYYTASEATNRWGTGNGGGAIAVTTK